MRKGDKTTFQGLLLGHFDYVHIRMNNFVGLRQTNSYVLLMFPLFE